MSVAHQPERLALVTGTLAEPALRRVAEALRASGRFEPTVVVLNIQVAALMTAEWVRRKLALPDGVVVDRVILPGHCRGDLAAIESRLGVRVEAGPYELLDLPDYLTGRIRDAGADSMNRHSIEIIAEINHAARLPLDRIVAMAEAYRRDGADVIDLGCDPCAEARDAWQGVGDVTRTLRAAGMRVSVDTFHPEEARSAVEAGAELVLSVNAGNLRAIADARAWGAKVVAIPDTPTDIDSLGPTLDTLASRGIAFVIDPILEPIGMGFAASLGRYLETRRRYPAAEIMMGVGNLTELTETDSAGVNAVLMGFCQEIGVTSVLTTQVINWARTSVRELDLARRLMFHAVAHRRPPKRIDPRLVTLRDPRLRGLRADEIAQLASGLTDRNIRLFADHETGEMHAMNRDFHASDGDPFELYDKIVARADIDASHAFYLGYELAKAVTALTLGKNYTQDVALRWGFLTREEVSHHDRRKRPGGAETEPA